MTFLVTGAGGFLGRHVVARLRALGLPVVTLGRNTQAGDTHFAIADLADAAAIQGVMTQVRPDFVLHLAGTATAEPLEEAYRVNAMFAARLLNAPRRLDTPPAILLAGSAAEYGPVAEDALPVTEATPCRPNSTYGITKLAQTLHGLAAAGDGLRVVVARLFNLVGGGMPAHLALGAFARQIALMPATGGTLRTGPLDRERDFVEVMPASDVLVALVRNPLAAGVINICSGTPQSLADFTSALIAQSGKPVTVQSDPGRGGNSDMVRHWGDATRLVTLDHKLAPADPARVARALLTGGYGNIGSGGIT